MIIPKEKNASRSQLGECPDCGKNISVTTEQMEGGTTLYCGRCHKQLNLETFGRQDSSSGRGEGENEEESTREAIDSDFDGPIEDLLDEYERRLAEAEWVDLVELSKSMSEIRLQLQQPTRLSFVGNFSVGKSMVINSLLGEEVAPTNVQRTTAVICHFRYGDTRRVRFHYGDGRTEDGDIFSFKRFSDHNRIDEEDAERLSEVDYVEVFYPSDVLRNVTLIDTPGLGSEAERDDETTRAHLREADAVCWVFDANEVGKRDELERIERLSSEFRSAFALVNKCDLKPPSNRPRIKNRAEDVVGDYFDDVLLYSAEELLDSKLDRFELTEEDRAHLCMNLTSEIQERVNSHATELRENRARAALGQLAEEHLEELSEWSDELNRVQQFYELLVENLDSEEERAVSEAQELVRQLNRKLNSILSSNQSRLEDSFNLHKGFLSDEAEVDTSGVLEFWNRVEDGYNESFEPWEEFPSEFATRAEFAIEQAAENVFDYDDNENDNLEIETALDEEFHYFILSYYTTKRDWSHQLYGIFAFSPLQYLQGSLGGALRVLADLCGLTEVGRIFDSLSRQEMNDWLVRYIYPDHPKDWLLPKLKSSDYDENPIRMSFEGLREVVQGAKEDLNEHMEIASQRRQLLEKYCEL